MRRHNIMSLYVDIYSSWIVGTNGPMHSVGKAELYNNKENLMNAPH